MFVPLQVNKLFSFIEYNACFDLVSLILVVPDSQWVWKTHDSCYHWWSLYCKLSPFGNLTIHTLELLRSPCFIFSNNFIACISISNEFLREGFLCLLFSLKLIFGPINNSGFLFLYYCLKFSDCLTVCGLSLFIATRAYSISTL